MKSLPVLWCLVSVSAVASLGTVVAQEKKDPKPKAESNIKLFTPHSKMWLHIYSDGAGTVGYGAGGSYQGIFKTGTFDVALVTKELKALAVEPESLDAWKIHYGIGFESEQRDPKKPVRFYTKDDKLILKLFEKAVESSDGLSNPLERPLLRAEIEKCKLRGTWVVTSAEADGTPVAALKGTELKIGDGEITAMLGGKEQPGTYKIDLAKPLKQIDFWIGDTTGNWFKSYGAYELDGDELRVCRTGDTDSVTGIQAKKLIMKEAAAKRPAKLDSKLGVLLILNREAK